MDTLEFSGDIMKTCGLSREQCDELFAEPPSKKRGKRPHSQCSRGRDGIDLAYSSLHHTKQSQTKRLTRVAFQGEPGAYSEKAAKKVFVMPTGTQVTASIDTVPCKSFEEMFLAVINDEVDYAVVPIENSLGGSIHANFDLMTRHRKELCIVGETNLPVQHCLLALPGTNLSEITHIISHPQALAQCQEYIRKQFPSSEDNPLKIQVEEVYDTAGSAKMIQTQSLRNHASIASDLAAELYGLSILARNIQDSDDNTTRFLVFQKTHQHLGVVPFWLPLEFRTTISVVLKTSAERGRNSNLRDPLMNILSIMEMMELSVTKIESRPIPATLRNKLIEKEDEEDEEKEQEKKWKRSTPFRF